MAQTLVQIRVEYDPYDGRMIRVYKDERGQLVYITQFTTLESVDYGTKVAEAEERLARQQIKTEVAKAELDDVRYIIEDRRQQLHQQLGGVTNLRALPGQPEIIPPRRLNGR